MLELDIKFEDDVVSSEEDCKGIFFRGYRNFYSQGKDIHLKQGFRFLKKMSCSGCKKCDWYIDQVQEMIYSDGVILPDEVKHGALYSVCVSNVGTDWETGIVDTWDFEFFEVK